MLGTLTATSLCLAASLSHCAPVALRSESVRYEAVRADDGTWITGARTGARTENRDPDGRLVRWSSEADGERLVWIGVYETNEHHPRRAAYWLNDQLRPEIELSVPSPDKQSVDVLYASPGEKPRRQMRIYFDDAGRELYQQYFASRSQKFYSEEIYAYDDRGNEIGRTWRRLNGTASRDTQFETLQAAPHGRWLRRLVTINGTPEAIDIRTIIDGPDRPVPPAASGPVERDDRIYPIPFAPGVVSTDTAGENMLSFTNDGDTAVFSRYDDWQTQTPMIVYRREGVWQAPEPLPFAKIVYNASINGTGDTIVYCVPDPKSDEGARVFASQRVQTTTAESQATWSEPADLTASAGIRGSYFALEEDGTLLYHLDGDLFSAQIDTDRPATAEKLPPVINTPEGVEFAPDLAGQRLLFTRYFEGDEAHSGIYFARRTQAGWTDPARLPIPYGWGARITPDGEDLVYTLDGEIVRIPGVLLPMLQDPVAE